MKNKVIDWSPNDYSPSYEFEVDGKGGFVRLLRVFDIPKGYKERKSIDIKPFHREYISGEGFERYKKHRAWLGDELYI